MQLWRVLCRLLLAASNGNWKSLKIDTLIFFLLSFPPNNETCIPIFTPLDGDHGVVKRQHRCPSKIALDQSIRNIGTSAKACLNLWQMLASLWVLVVQVALLVLQLHLSESLGMDAA